MPTRSESMHSYCVTLHLVILLTVVEIHASYVDIKENLPTIFRRYIGHGKANGLMRSSFKILSISLQIKIHGLGATNLIQRQRCFDQSEVLKCTISDQVSAVIFNERIKKPASLTTVDTFKMSSDLDYCLSSTKLLCFSLL